ncbi:MAG: S8 family serine peptidase, partial [Balneolales bacterium]|nr:S8 family serine peptidase [Balneolales bacterium]
MVKEGLKYLFSVSIIFLFSLPISAQQNPAEYMDNELIIKFRSEETAFNFKAKAARLPEIFYLHNIEVKDAIWKPEFENRLTSVIQAKGKVAVIPDFQGLRNVHKATFNSNVDALELARLISELPEIEYAEPRFLYMTELVTNDPIQNDFVSFHNFNEAWDLVSNSSDVIISIVDSGVNYGHEDLDEKHWLNEGEIPNNGLDDDGNGYIDDYLGWDFFDQAPDGSIIEDNNPFGTFSPHGTHVAGISTAIHDNELGLAGAGLNARFMAVKAGGIQDDPSTGVDESRQIGAGYEGILYSVINGADIINCSWGGGGISSFGEEVVNLARASGALVIASAGNDATDTESFPAAFENVLAVGALANGSSIANYSNFGEYVDVFASGTIRSSVGTSTTGYATFNGTSMAAPVVSGLAALVKANDPALTPEQIVNQIKNTSISIEAQNPPSFANKLGAGRIDAARAVGPLFPNIFVLEERYVDESGGSLGINEQGVMQITFSNSGGTTEDLSITISSQSGEIIIPESTFDIGILETGAETTVEVPIFLNEALLDSLTGDILIETEDPGIDYSTSRILVYDRLLFSVSSANNLAMSFSGNGNIGFYDPLNASGGIGFVPDHQTANFFRANLLYEGGIIMAANNTVINNVRALEGQPYDQDFRPLEFYNVESPGSISDADGTAVFTSKPESNIPNVEITLNTYAFDQTSTSNSILLNYIVKNNSNSLSLSEVYLGLFNDW